ncbi:GGDEF domain-containing phosphodiesterase [Butyrivibrio sp. MC2013]|uniref:GGDEF domain-containing phosphodiesterase n=1 Tax=Butyrivibrio sp. MC2013 TaxID=1280686 RepID=UPI00040EE2AC|nr:GGDEF domain-containing phosphodiesterase [Butyrivibrio sp. MC2013]
MQYNISFDICAICIDTAVLVMFFLRKNYVSKANRAYKLLVVDSLVAAVCDLATAYTISYPYSIPLWANYLVNTIFYLSINTILLWYCNYLLRVIYKTRPYLKSTSIFLRCCALLDIVLITSNPLTHFIFYFDENRQYCSGPFRIVVYAVSVLILIDCIYQTIRNWESLQTDQIFGMLFITVANTGSVVFQLFHPNQLITSFFVALAILVIYLSIQDVDNYIDPLTRVYNQQAFEDTLNSCVKTRLPFNIISIKLRDFRQVNEMAGVVAGNRVLEMTSKRIQNVVGKENVYYNSGTRFTVILDNKSIDEASAIEQLRTELMKAFEVSQMRIYLRPQMIVVHFPEHGSSSFELEDAISYCLHQLERQKISDIIYADTGTLESVRRNAKLDTIMHNALIDGSFKIYFQPIRDAVTGEYHSAEALLRLINDEYGFISPDDFIPRAEENGLIIKIGEFVFDEVCRLMQKYDFEGLGISFIEINLSAAQCIQKDLKTIFMNTMAKYRIPPEMINLEITETAAIASSERLLDFMKNMRAEGIEFSLDDYGSGLANVNYLLDYPFKIVKLDKSLVWKAFSERNAFIALEHTVRMMKELGYITVAEGVETDEQAEGLKNIGVDEFQGFLYSKAIPTLEFVNFMKENSRR